jgi:hydroxymethylbilane synthase
VTEATTRPLRIGTRGSALALAQAKLVAAALDAVGLGHEIVVIETEGDRRAPDTAWGEGAFVAALERSLLADEVDLAVHSAKDIPTDEDARLTIAAFLPRADPLDALVAPAGSAVTSLADLPAGSRVGTDSPRRAGFLLAVRPDLEIRPLHGNVDTRLRRLDEGQVDALVLAVAGLARLGREDRITERLPAEVVPPAPGQGAIAVQVRADDERVQAAVRRLDDHPTRAAVTAERAFLRATGGGCRAPVGALATVEGDAIRLLGGIVDASNRIAVDTIETATRCATSCAGVLATALASGLAARTSRPVALVTRPVDRAEPLVSSLHEQGVEAVVVPTIAVEAVPAGGPLDDALVDLPADAWAIVTSANGARAVVDAARRLGVELGTVRWAAVGQATAAVLTDAGVADVWLPPTARSRAIAAALPLSAGERVVLFRGSLADDDLPAELRARGAVVRQVVVYGTVEAPKASAALLSSVLARHRPSAVLFASESAVRGLVALAAPDAASAAALLSIPAICIGPATTRQALAAGFGVLGQSSLQSSAALAELTGRLLRLSPGDAA